MTHVKTPFCWRLKGRAKSVRRCEDDTVTHDTQCTGKGFTPETLGVASAGFTKKKVSRSEGLRTCGGPEHPKHQPADFTFRVLGSITRTESDPPSIASVKSSSIGILRPFLLLLRRSPLPVLGFFDGETLLGISCQRHPVRNATFNRPEVIVIVEQSASIADVSIQRG